MSEIKYKMLPLPSVFMMEADFPMEHVDTLNTFLISAVPIITSFISGVSKPERLFSINSNAS